LEKKNVEIDLSYITHTFSKITKVYSLFIHWLEKIDFVS